MDDLRFWLALVEVEDGLSLLTVDLHALTNDVLLVIITDYKRNNLTIVALLRVLLRQQGLHEVAVPVDVCNIVVPIALRADTPSHEFLKQNVVSIHEIEDKINADVMPGKHVSLSDRAWHAIQDEHRSVFVLDLASTLDDLNGHLIADEVTTTECLA